MQKKRMTRNDIARIVLGAIAIGGIIAFPAIIPVIGAAYKIIDPHPRRAHVKVRRTLNGLVKNGKVTKTSSGYHLTPKGDTELARGKFDTYQFPKLKQWDKKWRVICFDIPEKRKYVRHLIQHKLVEVGCYRLQDSIFVTPQNCKELLSLIQGAFFLKKHVRGLVVTEMDDEKELLSYFRLTRS